MTPLPSHFPGRADQRGFSFSLIKRTGNLCLYQKSKPGHAHPLYEVVLLRNVPIRTFPNGITTEAHEAMPSPEEWGTSGWSQPTLEAAHQKFDRLLSQSP